MIAQIQSGKFQSTQMTADYKGDAHTTSLTLGNPDLIHGSGVGVVHYLRTVTPWLALGAELAYQVRLLLTHKSKDNCDFKYSSAL